jgi:hypothetical protein
MVSQGGEDMAVRSIESSLLEQYFLDISDSTPLGSTLECGLAKRIQQVDQEARNELLNGKIFTTLQEAKVSTEVWRREYN